MDQNEEILFESVPYIRIYKSGLIERFDSIELVPSSVDATTGVSSKDIVILPEIGVSARIYVPKLVDDLPKRYPVVVYYHGGGFFIGSAFASLLHDYLNSLVAQTNVVVISIDYRLAPEHPIPTAYNDSWLALRWVTSQAEAGADAWLSNHADFQRIFLAGDSAGANIAHHMALRAGTDQLGCSVHIKGLVLIHPYFLATKQSESDMIDPSKRLGYEILWKMVCPSTTSSDDHWINPIADGAPSLSGLGCERVLVCVGEKDVLRDRGRDYYERLRGSEWGGEVVLYETEGEGHAFHFFNPTCEKALPQDRKISCFLNLC